MDTKGKGNNCKLNTLPIEAVVIPAYIVPEDRCGIASAGWGVMVCAGVVGLTFLLCISLAPSNNIFPVPHNLYANNIPLNPQGKLRIYPDFSDQSSALFLPPKNLEAIMQSMQSIIDEYPQDYISPYVRCWLQNPSYNHPCFFDINWINNTLYQFPDFGYTEINGTFNPCVLLRMEKTGAWDPIPYRSISASEHSDAMFKEYDPGYIRLNCRLKHSTDAPKLRGIRVFPEKGFPRLFFPQTAFNLSQYLTPMVIMQAEGLRAREDVIIVCNILVENAMYLEDYGEVTINFKGNEQ